MWTPRALILLAATTAALSSAPAAAGATPRFASGFESGFAGWGVQAMPGRATIVKSGAMSGRRAARFEVRPGDVEPGTKGQRAEVFLQKPLLREGQTVFVGDSIRLDRTFVDTDHFQSWRILSQLHETTTVTPPGLAVFADPGPRLGLRSGTSRPSFWRGPVIARGSWYRLVYQVHLSQDPAQGWVRVWLNGRPQILENGQLKMNGTTLRDVSGYLKFGIYRSKFFTDTSIVSHDDVTVGSNGANALAGLPSRDARPAGARTRRAGQRRRGAVRGPHRSPRR